MSLAIDSRSTSELAIRVQGRSAVVTGAGSGIGYAVAKALLQSGANVACWDIRLTPELQSLERQYGDRTAVMAVDVASVDEVEQAGLATAQRFGGVDIVVNCAGVMYKDKVGEIDMAAWDRIYSINVKGTLFVNQTLVPYLKRSGCGRIINIASMTALIGLETYAPYSSSKAAVSNMTKVMAAELAPFGVTVNALCPGWVDTPMLSALFDRIGEIHGLEREQAKDEVLRHVPQRRFIHPDEIAFAVLFLSSPLAQGISALDLSIDNGLANTFKPGLHMKHD
ncbi:hypothetical protein SD70_05770 [Gordoniibacillus kamchatkensis]|uniref:Ketoreductase domain-containing protein n=1 Tax=Gordoniibacillus kamchatkensis TaxID=1590651 RepID=A0ABR5AL83_9BACL|nr:SDR family oxidoreductase [Paenibacillus sp. VKM B-2647]KIL41633.1 hypothetical protein SD70_05770 [Paenibacillus sp. VKM B-2647]